MGLFGNFFARSAGPTARAAQVSGAATGAIYAIVRLLGTASTLALISGTSSNLTLSGSAIAASSALVGASQTAIVRETSGQLAVEYPVTLTGDGTAPPPSSGLPAADKLVMDYRAEYVTGVADGGNVTQMTDAITGHTAVPWAPIPGFSNRPVLRKTGFGGQPTLYFEQCAMDLGPPPAALYNARQAGDATICVVYRVPAAGPADQYRGPFGQSAVDGAINIAMSCDGNTINGGGANTLPCSDVGPPGTLVVQFMSVNNYQLPVVLGYGRSCINGTLLPTSSSLGPIDQTNALTLGCVQRNNSGYFMFKGEIMAVMAWSRSLLLTEQVRAVRYWHDKYSQPYPWAGYQSYHLYAYNSIMDGVGVDAANHSAPYFAETFLGRKVGGHANLSRASGWTNDIWAIVQREIAGLSTALGIPVTVIAGEWGNGSSPSWQVAHQNGITGTKQVDPTCKIAFITSTDLGDVAGSDGLATKERTSESDRQAFNAYWYDASRPNGIAAGRTGLDLVIPLHLNDKVGLPGTSFGSQRATYFSDPVHPTGNGSADCGTRQSGYVTMGPALQAAGLGS